MKVLPAPRRSPLAFLLAAATLLYAGCSGTNVASPDAPNLILISIDTLRPDFLGCYGYERDVSPAIDALAAEGTVFTDVTAASPWTLPSHASMLTGLYPSTHGVKDHDRRLTAETLALRFRKVGYRTLAVVNSHNIGEPAYGLLRGFDEHVYVNEMTELENGRQIIDNKGGEITRQGLQWLREKDPRPFFLFLHYYDVHTDFTPKPKWKLEFVDDYAGKLNGLTGQLVGYRRKGLPLSEADIKWLKQMYSAEIRSLDEILVRLFNYLDVSGKGENTIVAITSDHGEEYFEHGGVLHGRTHYQELLAIPLILRGPGVPVGLRVDDPVHLVDVAPTLLSLAGIETGLRYDGIDLTDHWLDPGAVPEARFLFGEADHNNQIDRKDVIDIRKMVRLKMDKLCYDEHTGVKELYDLAVDPGEQDDRAAEDPERVAFLWSRLEEFMANEGTGEPIPPPDEETMELLRQLGYVGDDR